ncbi:hypothetical protein [Pseudovibrio denitrificans]|uniref:hypothetical protein n=1 Tax=Pseudovibrio denitrificans TaxID=258256 RepID=UPI000FFC0283|nr:hypothetical protein [Pseudovibrio denitrificans]
MTAEVLPALRQSGIYSMGPTPQKPEPPDAKQVLLVNEMNARANLLKEARYIYGREAAMALWDRLGLPDIAGEGVNEVAGTAADDPDGCLKHLINFTCGRNLSVRIALAFAWQMTSAPAGWSNWASNCAPTRTRMASPSPTITSTCGRSSASPNGTATGNSPSKNSPPPTNPKTPSP